MIVSIMQPYFFPYIGYFQLIHASDVFVLYDDVQYKRGWINRNRILLNGADRWLTYPVTQGSATSAICNRTYVHGLRDREHLLHVLEEYYRYARYFDSVYALVAKCLEYSDPGVASFNANLIRTVADYLGIQTEMHRSSDLSLPDNFRGQDRIIEICRRFSADTYVNPPGGTHLYSADVFDDYNMRLRFLNPVLRRYSQGSANFVPALSIIDVMMFNSKDEIGEMLNEFELCTSEEMNTAYQNKTANET